MNPVDIKMRLQGCAGHQVPVIVEHAELPKLIEAGLHHIPSVCIHSKFTVEYDSQVAYFL